MARSLSLGLAILLLVFAYSWGLVGVGKRAATERDVGGDAITLGALGDDASAPRELVRADLREGQAVIFELCADDGFSDAWTRTAGLEILFAEDGRFDVVRRVPFDSELAERVQREPSSAAEATSAADPADREAASAADPADREATSAADPADREATSAADPADREAASGSGGAEGVGCVVIGDAESLGVSGEYVIALAAGPLPRELADVRARARVIAWTPLALGDRIGVWAALAGALQLVVALALPRRRRDDADADDAGDTNDAEAREPSMRNAMLRVTLGVTVMVGALFGVSLVPVTGVGGAVVRGLIVALLEVVAAFFLVVPAVSALRRDAVRPPKIEALGLIPPRRAPIVWLALAPLLGLALVILGRLIVALVPATGLAPIELFVEMPSGRLAVALVAVFVPVAEELFFRGFVFGTLERVRGANVALAFTVILFAVVHLPQQWGAWGAFASVATTGLALTLMRRFTGSTLLCALVHLGHNAWITLLSI
ncbi:MAG: CPBP family intramembrane metalloprotease [Myxococcota bacterium]|nr:CPBP family intramembrane metalloprotease [Myxococcota bacterium]